MRKRTMAPTRPDDAKADAAKPSGWAWLVFALGASFFCYAFFQRVAPSVMIDQLMVDLGVGGAMLGNLSALYFYAYASLQIPAGALMDRWGARRMVALAIALCALGSVISGLGPNASVVYVGRLLTGIGAAFSFVGALQLATYWFPAQRFALLSGLVMLAGMSGGIAGQAPLALVVDATGWRPAMIGAGLVGLALAAAFVLIVRDRPGKAATADTPSNAPSMLAGLAEVASKPHNWLLALVASSMSAPLLAFAGLWGVGWLMQVHGFSRPLAAILTSMLLAGWAFGAPMAGWLSDRFRRRKAPLVACSLGGFVMLTFVLYAPLASPWTFAVLFLICGALLGCMALTYPLAGETNRIELSGTAYAFCNTFNVASGALFQPLIGWLLDLGWDGTMENGARIYSPEAYAWALAVLPAYSVLGLIASLMIRESGAKRMA